MAEQERKTLERPSATGKINSYTLILKNVKKVNFYSHNVYKKTFKFNKGREKSKQKGM